MAAFPKARSSPLVSVIMPTHNHAAFIREAISSVLAQTHVSLELIIVDDASTDKTQEHLRRLRDPRVTLIRHARRLGIARSKNDGIRLAAGGYVTFFDSDDIMLPDALRKRVAFLRPRPGAGAVFARLAGIVDANGRPLAANSLTRTIQALDRANRLRKQVTYELMASGTCFYGYNTLLYRRPVVDRIGFFDESLPGAEDFDYALRAAKVSPLVFMDAGVYRYRIHATNVSVVMTPANEVLLKPACTNGHYLVLAKHGLRRSVRGRPRHLAGFVHD